MPVDRSTPFLLPPSLQEWLPENHRTRFVVEIVDQLGLTPLEKAYAGRGSAYRLKTSAGRALQGRRKSTVEPVFGQIKHVLGFRQFMVRGFDRISGEWCLVTIAYNIRRLFQLRGGRAKAAVEAVCSVSGGASGQSMAGSLFPRMKG